MRLIKGRVQNYRSIKDTGEFDIEKLKTILVGPNEAGKSVLLKALQQLNKPDDIEGFDILRDYPRSLYNDISSEKVKAEDIEIVRGYFELDEDDKRLVPEEYKNCTYVVLTKLNNKKTYSLENAPPRKTYADITKELSRLITHIDEEFEKKEASDPKKKPSVKLKVITNNFSDTIELTKENTIELKNILSEFYPLINEENKKEDDRYSNILETIEFNNVQIETLNLLSDRIPVFVLFNNYFKVKPSINLEHLAERVEKNLLENDQFYDYGNLCLLKLLSFKVRELANIGNTKSPSSDDHERLNTYKKTLDDRTYRLNAASIKLTNEIKKIWNPDPKRPEAEKIRISADGQYLKVVVEDEIGVEIELDQRSEGFQWIISFFVVFFAEAMDKHKNAILLLDEPGMSLHGLKQRQFRKTLSTLSINNQTIYTTHSPFLVGANELDLVRVVELKTREEGTKVHTTISSSDPSGLLPLQEALGYDLAQSLFTHQKNLILEGLTDYWYIEATSSMLKDLEIIEFDNKIALVFANSAGKVVYYATILHSHNLKIAALLDSDAAGDQAAQQDNLVHTLGNKNILRTKDYCSDVNKPEIEDLLRETLINIVESEYSVQIKRLADDQPNRSITAIFSENVENFSKYKLAKAYLKWCKTNDANLLTKSETEYWKKLIGAVNKALK